MANHIPVVFSHFQWAHLIPMHQAYLHPPSEKFTTLCIGPRRSTIPLFIIKSCAWLAENAAFQCVLRRHVTLCHACCNNHFFPVECVRLWTRGGYLVLPFTLMGTKMNITTCLQYFHRIIPRPITEHG